MNILTINEKVFQTQIVIIGNASEKEANKYLKSIKNPYLIEEEQNMAARLVKTKLEIYRILYIKDLSKKNIPKLSHEIFHLVVRICEDKGVPIVPNIHTGHCGDETAAYLMEFYMDQVLSKIK